MGSQEVPYSKLEKIISVSFEGDNEIVELYDPNVKVETVSDVVKDIVRKISELKGHIDYRVVYEKGFMVGYYVFQEDILISFCLNISYRTEKYLNEFFGLIVNELGKPFICSLWTKNKRGIKWLEKNNMEIHYSDNNITQLICQ